jgi:hypothetical protein
MNLTEHLAKHLRDVFFGGNWTVSNMKDTLTGLDYKQATKSYQGLNSIAALTYHIQYFILVASKVLEGGPLEGSDALSFDLPPIDGQEDWDRFLENLWTNAEHFATCIENTDESLIWEVFQDEKYGNYYRNIQGIIEHTHYHLGQIAIIKKLIVSEKD